MKRREFITLLGGVAVWPLVARGQEPGRIYRLGVLFAGPRDAPHYVALFNELRRLGFIEGQNLVNDAAGYGLPPERMEVHAADLVSGLVDVILAAGDAAVRAPCCGAAPARHVPISGNGRAGWPHRLRSTARPAVPRHSES